MKVVEIVVDDSCLGAFLFGDMGQEAAASEQIDEHGSVGELGQCLPELADKTAFLSLERQRGGIVNGLFLHSAKMFL